jgi:type VI secretion system protein ImpM
VTESAADQTTEPLAAIPGWYGKLPSLGDFASRRLPPEFINAWDAWLQAVLQAVQDTLGEGWLNNYLTTPIWRFVLLSGLAGPSGWAGVLMPSVDRVGRYFPLTVATELPSHTAMAHAVFAAADWFAGLEEAALGMLGSGQGPDELDAALANLALKLPQPDEVEKSVEALQALRSTEAFESVAKTRALAAWSQQEGWRALWWTRGRVDGDPLMFASAALPTAAEFAKLLESGKPSAPAILGP